MPRPSPHSAFCIVHSTFFRPLFLHWPILILALWFGGMTVLLDRAVDLFASRVTTAPPDLAAPAPWRDARLFVDPDSYAWLSYARDLRESPHSRVRWTHMDNAPHGRPVHWAQLPIWSLCAISAVLETAGIPSPTSLELAGRILLPLLGFLSFSALWIYLRRRVPPLVAALVALSLAVALFWDFHPLRPDHHGFQLVAVAAFVLPLLFSSFGLAPPSRRNRLPFIVSGVLGGIALWLGATVFFFTLAAAALAAALAILPKRAPAPPPLTPDSSLFAPHYWRLWGLSGAVTSLFFWLLEYAPGHFSMRLEANHPLYALSFLGIGECLFLLMRFRRQNRPVPPSFLLHAALALSAAAALPALVLFGPVSWYIPRSTLMLRLHARHIDECTSLFTYAAVHSHSVFGFLLPAVVPALAAIPFLRRPFSRRLLFALPFHLVFLALFLWQNRWERFAVLASMLPLLAVASDPPAPHPGAPSSLPRFRRLLFSVPRFLPVILLLALLSWSLWNKTALLPAYWYGKSTDPTWRAALQCGALATQFRPALADPAVTPTPNASSPVVLAPAEYAPYLYYCARIPSVASLFWENLPGNAAAAEAFADTSPGAENAAAIVASRRISHLFMLEGPVDALLFDDLRTGVYDQSHAAATLAAILSGAYPGAILPPWLAVDTDLNRLANPALFAYVPPRDAFVPLSLPLRIYSLMPGTIPEPAEP